jgi:arginine exporter protein ArgO
MLTRLEPFFIVGTLLAALIWLLMLPLGDVLEYAGLDEDNVGLIQRACGPALWAVAFTATAAWLIRRQ